MKKWNSERGESIAEVLVAALVVALGALLLATMVISAQRLIRRSSETYEKNMAEKNAVEAMPAGDDSAALIVTSGTLRFGALPPSDTGVSFGDSGALRSSVRTLDGGSVQTAPEFTQEVRDLKIRVTLWQGEDRTALKYAADNS